VNAPVPSKSNLRLDELLVARGEFASRSRVRDAIARGAVLVDGRPASKAGQAVSADASLTIEDPARRHVSRAALKLIAGLDHFKLDPAGTLALDIGASTGGFTQVLLERGADRVIAVDVGHGQLDPSLKTDARVTSIEGLNARNLTAADLGGRRPGFIAPDFIVCDVSFISLKLALAPALALAAPGAKGLFLVKPQFEAGRQAIGKGGLLRDAALAPRIADDLEAWLDAQPGWRALGLCPSPIAGGEGNREFLLAGSKDR
jgi:23S rRNA (cytidine1920-2'-O)/16S rRNA (cytidine1409-2'-O)-methyltransferase